MMPYLPPYFQLVGHIRNSFLDYFQTDEMYKQHVHESIWCNQTEIIMNSKHHNHHLFWKRNFFPLGLKILTFSPQYSHFVEISLA